MTLIGALLVIVGVFAPFVQASMTYNPMMSMEGMGMGGFSATQIISRHANLMSVFYGLGWVVLMGAVIVAILAVVRQNLAALIVTGLADLVVAYAVARAGAEISRAGGTTSLYSFSYGFGAGAWLLIIGAIVMLIGTIIAFYNEVNSKKIEGQAQVNPQYQAQYMPPSAQGQGAQPHQAAPHYGMTPAQADQVNGQFNPPQAPTSTSQVPMQGASSPNAVQTPQQGNASNDVRYPQPSDVHVHHPHQASPSQDTQDAQQSVQESVSRFGSERQEESRNAVEASDEGNPEQPRQPK